MKNTQTKLTIEQLLEQYRQKLLLTIDDWYDPNLPFELEDQFDWMMWNKEKQLADHISA